MIELIEKQFCTGCGACAEICPQTCISMQPDDLGTIYPIINTINCIECNRCKKVCPILNPVGLHNPIKAYAAWSLNEEERKTSASGGIAIEAYRYALENQYIAVGAKCMPDFKIKMSIAEKKEELIPFKNSKYVFSEAYDLYPKLKKYLKNNNQKCIIIGLPCQISAIRKIFKDNQNLLLIDVVCHGITSFSFLITHIKKLENDYNQKVKRFFFRDPAFSTSTYHFSLYNESDNCFYSKCVNEDDTYHFGFHKSISYRENCYNCKFARKERTSDITLSDYTGLGKLSPCAFSSNKVSSILVNTDKGQRFIEALIKENRIFVEERPLMEPILGDERLRRPTIKNTYRYLFEKLIIKYNGDFEKAMDEVIKVYNFREKLLMISILPKLAIKKCLILLYNAFIINFINKFFIQSKSKSNTNNIV